MRIPPVLETERLRLRDMRLSDLDFLAEMVADPEVMRFFPRPWSRVEAQGSLEKNLRRYTDHGHGFWLVEERATELPVGRVGLLFQEVDGQAEFEIGYMIHRPFWRQGYATEGAFAVRQYAFEQAGLDRVISLVRPENLPSQGVARKLGMQPERETIFMGLRHLVFTVRRVG